jgi:hypothetical protein
MKKFASTSFLWSELECKCGCGNRFIQREAIHKLQLMRNLLGKPIIINSAARCPIHNTTVGGAPKSQHRATESRPSTAFDISLRGQTNSKYELITLAKQVGFRGLGTNYKSFVHVDNRKVPAIW